MRLPSNAASNRDDRDQRPAVEAHLSSPQAAIESSTPRRAEHRADQDRSMPPVMITIAAPMLKMPYIPISRAWLVRLVRLRKRGFR